MTSTAKCQGHHPLALYVWPADPAAQLTYVLHHYGDYHLCANCGRLGHRIKSRRGGIRWWAKDSVFDERFRNADTWNRLYTPIVHSQEKKGTV